MIQLPRNIEIVLLKFYMCILRMLRAVLLYIHRAQERHPLAVRRILIVSLRIKLVFLYAYGYLLRMLRAVLLYISRLRG